MIVGCVGPIGTGKTGLMASRAIRRAVATDAILASNIRLRPPEGVEFVPLPIGEDGLDWATLQQVSDRARAGGRRLVVLADEVGIVMGSRFWQSTPAWVIWWLAMARRFRVDLYWTAHDVDDVEVALRRRTHWTYSLSRVPGGGEWGTESPPWLLVARRWRAVDVGKRGRRIGLPAFIVWRRSWHGLYDTDEIVPLPGRLARVRAAYGRSGASWAVLAGGVSGAAERSEAGSPDVSGSAAESAASG